MSKFQRILVGVMTCLLFMAGGKALAASGQHEVTANKLYFRAEASTDGKIITRLSKGTVVTVLSTDDGWAKAHWNGTEGYLSTEYLKKITSASESGSNTTQRSGTGWIRKTTPMYEVANSNTEPFRDVEKFTEVKILGETMYFYYVETEGERGYVIKGRVVTEKPEAVISTEKNNSKNDKTAATEETVSNLLQKGCQGDEVRSLQKKLYELGYLKERHITGYYGDVTYNAVMQFQLCAHLTVDGIAGRATLNKLDSSNAPHAKEVVEMDWYESDVSSMVKKRGGTAAFIDCETGVVINIRRVGGSNHMDVEPLTAEDTAKLKELYDGEWSWARRSVILVADGEYIAASINGMPHGAEISKTNDFEGQFCLHTTNSRTHGTDKVDRDHQNHIEEALHY